jgi:hypothetical protein
MKEDDLEIVPLIEVGAVYRKDEETEDMVTCRFLQGEMTAPMVIGICLGIIDSFIRNIDEKDQSKMEDLIFDALNEERDNRHEYIDGVDSDGYID